MRIRSLKPEILTDEKTAGLTDTEWRLFVSCIVMADDYGNFRASPAFLHTQVFWGVSSTRDAVEKARETLARVSLLSLYEVKGQSYGHVNGWAKHQRVDHPGKPLCPGQELAESTPSDNSSRESQENLAITSESLKPDRDQDLDKDKDRDGVSLVFAHYKTKRPKCFPRVHSGLKEWRLVRERIEKDGRTVEDLCRSIDGYFSSPWHRGENDRGKKYLDLELIVRDEKHVAGGIELLEHPEKPLQHAKTATLRWATPHVD